MSCALFKLDLFVRAVLGTDFVLLIDRFCYAFFLFSPCHHLTCRVLKCNAIS